MNGPKTPIILNYGTRGRNDAYKVAKHVGNETLVNNLW